MFWFFLNKFRKNKALKSTKKDDSAVINDAKYSIEQLLLKLDELKFYENNIPGVLSIPEKSFDMMSVTDPYGDFSGSLFNESDEEDEPIKVKESSGSTIIEVNGTKGLKDSISIINTNYKKTITNKMKTLQCPFTWHLDPSKWNLDFLSRIKNKYGFYNMDIESLDFSVEKFVSNLIVGCVLFKTDEPEKSYNTIINIWKWLDKIDDACDSFYLSIRTGLKHIVMSTLTFIHYTSHQTIECQRLFQMTTPFNNLCKKSRAAVFCMRAAVCIEYGGKEIEKAIECAKIACELDPDTAYWHYILSLAMSAQRQFLHTNKSCPTEAEFNAIQYAIILLGNEQNPYFNFHRMNLMKTKIHYYHNLHADRLEEELAVKIKKDYQHVAELIRTIVDMQPKDPHLFVRCAQSLMTLPMVICDTYSAKDILLKALDVSRNDRTVIRAIEKSIRIYNKMSKIQEPAMDNLSSEIDIIQIENDEERKLQIRLNSVVEKHNNGRDPIVDLVKLVDECDEDNKWELLAQICSYTILWKGPSFLRTSVEQFMMLIKKEDNANSDIVTGHCSIFSKDTSVTFNLAELLCNEIKLVVLSGGAADPKDTQYLLDQLTTIMEVCRIKSKEADPTMRSRLLTKIRQVEEDMKPEPNGHRQNHHKRRNKKSQSRRRKWVYKKPNTILSKRKKHLNNSSICTQ
ncbi:uncharacterized protein LOC126841804 [Adelges cooleyi]|uniref:uncharacterized protein LOC126841804 n=1 Tax=Adelges cooleyi TaxID=133065 RepID=UPI0021808D23|nr:uncharacterized protein LOC126841804 [Adelges cooleyi]